MAIKEWWADDPTERYWLEITDRENLGADLHAPKRNQSGAETWSYSLVTHAEVGDVVFHWWQQPGQAKAVVGYSRVSGPVDTSTIRWSPHTSGAGEAPPVQRPAWLVPLSDYTDLPQPLTLADLRDAEPNLRALWENLRGDYGDPVYFPFVFSDKRPLRTAQGYFAKLPAAFVELFDELRPAADLPFPASANDLDPGAPPSPRPPAGAGYQDDPEVRRAIERHAVNWVLAELESQGYLVEDVGDRNPFDVLALDPDGVEVHIEVKGSSGTATTVELTHGEVTEASKTEASSVLVVVDQIEWRRSSDGIKTTGGRPRVWWEWWPDPERLQPTKFRYLLPPED